MSKISIYIKKQQTKSKHLRFCVIEEYISLLEKCVPDFFPHQV